jgi:RNA 2',3'-cyclic 3'-phosphodiesterase
VRLFIALDIPEDVRERLANLVAGLRAAARARWTRVEGLHVTLKFIGEASEEKAEEIRGALAAIRTGKAIEMSFRGVGFFPNPRHPRVFWTGIEAGEELAALAEEIEARLVPLSIPAESRPFHAHLTLARFDSPQAAPAFIRALEGLGPFEFGRGSSSEFYLYRSQLKRGGAEYERLASFPFAQAAA